MSCIKRGGLAAFLAVLVAAGCVACLLPKIFWVESKDLVSGSAHGVNVTINGTMKISLWRTCLTYDDVTMKNNITTRTTKTKCNPVQKFSFKDIKTEKTAERDGAIAGLVLGGIFALSSLIGVARHSKAATITLLVLAVVCTAATVGCFVRFKLNTLDNELTDGEYKFVAGFWGACGTFALALVTTIVSCCMSTKSDEYFELA